MRRVALLALLALVTLLGACGATDSEPDGSGSPSAESLDGRRFVADEVSIEFEDGRIGGSAGCNSISGEYRVDDGVLVVGDLAMTEMACPGREDRDAWLVGLLTARPTVTLEADQLTLTTDAESLVLLDRRVADPDRPLVGTRWELTTIIDGEAASSVPEGVEVPWVEFGDAGEASWYDGCNWGGGPTEISDNEVRIGETAQTTRGCLDESATAVTEAFQRVLGPGTTTYDIDGPALQLQRGETGLGFSAA
jgi:heat shock protein HslJ